ncbi:C-type lectin domain family 4 member C-like [Trichechus manatus latirostris]|uniref:C-type lectin domain family 4 member C-like n=1 Tax=Trichechus manatus latirostris TaxID=127582 RepID=A0A2Y9RYW8_TRIMA|nr:C-type lectin domain family 4 member C-like [Trichechus manatus latirostris]XP_023597309.1 C-type lectin domain family 4 member C-like [Trichechus manatus latirostris]
MVLRQPQDRGREVWWHQVKVWSAAVVSVSLLSACFIVSCLVNHDIFVNSKIGKKLSKQQEYEPFHSTVTCHIERKGLKGKGWSCCPENWVMSNTSCYFISSELNNWTESEKNCAGMGAHLLVINAEEEQLLITQKLDRKVAYYVGLSDSEGTHQ